MPNSLKLLLVILACCLSSGCGWFGANSNKPVAKSVTKPSESKQESETKETVAVVNNSEKKVNTPEPKKERRTGVSSLFKTPEIPEEFLLAQKVQAEAKAAGESKPKQVNLPKVRLIGFAKIDGQFKALIDANGNIVTVETGDVIDGIEIVEVLENKVAFQFMNSRWSTQLFEQPWLNEQRDTNANVASGRSTGRSSSAHSRTAKPIFASNRASSTQPAADATGGNVPGIPGVSSTYEAASIPGIAATPGQNAGIPGVDSIMSSNNTLPGNGSMPGVGSMPGGTMPGGASMPGAGMPGGSMPAGGTAMPSGGAMPGGAAMPGGGAMPGGAAMPGGGAMPAVGS